MDFGKIFQGFAKTKTDVAGFDIGNSSVNAVRMHRSGDTISLLAATILDIENESTSENKDGDDVISLEIPPELKAQYACLTVSGARATIKLLSFPGAPDEKMEEKIVGSMGIRNPDDFRISYQVTATGDAHNESRILTVAVPETEAQRATSLFETGLPAPFTLEISGLASMTAFLHGPGTKHESDVIGVIEFGYTSSTFALFNKNSLALLRRFNFGTQKLVQDIQNTLGVDEKTAGSILADGSFDISQTANELLAPIITQLVVSRDFIERRENCHVSNLYVSGGMIGSSEIIANIRKAMGINVEIWSPIDNITVGEDVFPKELKGQEWRFASAIGACLATLEKS